MVAEFTASKLCDDCTKTTSQLWHAESISQSNANVLTVFFLNLPPALYMDFACPKCSTIVTVNDDQTGSQTVCPSCQQTIKVPGAVPSSSSNNDDQWSIFDDEEQFFEEPVNSTAEQIYRTKADDLEPIIDNDEEAAAKEELEEQQEIARTIQEAKSAKFTSEHSYSSDLTVDEQIEEDAKLKRSLEELPADSPLKRKPWDRTESIENSLENLQLGGESTESLRAKCSVCESVSDVSREKVGQVIVCSDCGSNVQVPTLDELEQSKQKSKPDWQSWVQKDQIEKQQKRKVVDELFDAAPTHPKDYNLSASDDDEYGLAPADESLLKPVVPTYDAVAIEGEENTKPGGQEDKSGSAIPPMPSTSPRPVREKKDISETVTSALFEEMQAEKEVKFERLPWSKHIFGVLTDIGFLARIAMVGLAFAVTFTLYMFANYLAEQMPIAGVNLFFKFPAFVVAWVSLLCIFWLGQTVINTTLVGQKRFDELGSFSVLEWLSTCVFVGFSFVICAGPGVSLGYIVARFTDSFDWIWLLPAFGSLTALIFMPLPLISALANRSPFIVFSNVVAKSIKEKAELWVEFYPVAGLTAFAIFGTWFLGAMDIWIIGLLMSGLLALLFGLYFRMLGRLAGSVLNDEGGKKDPRTKH